MSAMASQITNFTIVYSSIYAGAVQRKHQSSASLAFVQGIHRWPMNSTHKGPVTRKMFPFDDFIMCVVYTCVLSAWEMSCIHTLAPLFCPTAFRFAGAVLLLFNIIKMKLCQVIWIYGLLAIHDRFRAVFAWYFEPVLWVLNICLFSHSSQQCFGILQ